MRGGTGKGDPPAGQNAIPGGANNAGASAGAAKPPKIEPPAASAVVPSRPSAAAEVTLVFETTPPGARVIGAADQLLGTTPVTLTRPAHGADLNLRFEKDGYAPVSRAVSLAHDGTLSITLERKPKPAAHPRRPVIDEPARL
jgi:hypothetical protein